MGKETSEATRRMVRLAQGNLCGIQLWRWRGSASAVSQAQAIDVPLDQKATTTATNIVESGIGDLRSVAGHQAEQADSMLPIEAMNYSANTIADVSHQYEHYARKLWDRNKYATKHFSVIRRGRKVRPLRVLMCVWQRSHLKSETLCAGDLAALRSSNTKKYDGFADTQSLKVFPTSEARATIQRHTEHGHRKIIAIMDATFACSHTNMDNLIHAHPPRETVSDIGGKF